MGVDRALVMIYTSGDGDDDIDDNDDDDDGDDDDDTSNNSKMCTYKPITFPAGTTSNFSSSMPMNI